MQGHSPSPPDVADDCIAVVDRYAVVLHTYTLGNPKIASILMKISWVTCHEVYFIFIPCIVELVGHCRILGADIHESMGRVYRTAAAAFAIALQMTAGEVELTPLSRRSCRRVHGRAPAGVLASLGVGRREAGGQYGSYDERRHFTTSAVDGIGCCDEGEDLPINTGDYPGGRRKQTVRCGRSQSGGGSASNGGPTQGGDV